MLEISVSSLKHPEVLETEKLKNLQVSEHQKHENWKNISSLSTSLSLWKKMLAECIFKSVGQKNNDFVYKFPKYYNYIACLQGSKKLLFQ